MGLAFNRIQLFLGVGRLRLLVALFIATGILSAILGKVGGEWAAVAPTLLTLAFLAAAVVIVISRMEGDARYRWGNTLMPAIGILALAVLFFPQYMLAAFGAACGWIVAGLFIFGKTREPMQYQLAVKAFRKNDYEAAVKAMDEIIKLEPDTAHHYRFRAEILRVWGKHDRARRDYQQMLKLAQDDGNKAIAYNGLAEVDLQVGRLNDAYKSAQEAYSLAPQEWVAAYNLGMIQDRMANSAGAISSLTQALAAKVPDARHRLLIFLYLARAHSRQGNLTDADAAIKKLNAERAGLREWESLLQSDQAQTLREVMARDIETARQLVDGQLTSAALAESAVQA